MSAPKMNRAAAEMMLQDWNETDAARAERDEARAEARRLRMAIGSAKSELEFIHRDTTDPEIMFAAARALRSLKDSGIGTNPIPKKRKNTAKTHGTYWSHVNADRDTIQEMMRSDRQSKRKSARGK